jgi:hypothetical protein
MKPQAVISVVLLLASVVTGCLAAIETYKQVRFWAGARKIEWVQLEMYDRPPYNDKRYEVSKAVLVQTTENGVVTKQEWPLHDLRDYRQGVRNTVYVNERLSEWTVPAGFAYWRMTCLWNGITIILIAIAMYGLRGARCRPRDASENNGK